MESYLSLRLGDNSQYSGVLAALVPDYRGRIREIRIGTKTVEVEIECLAGSSERDLIGKLFEKYCNGISITVNLNFTDYKASAEIRDFPRDLLVVLLSRKDGELVDRRTFLSGSQYVTEGVTIEAPEQDLVQIYQLLHVSGKPLSPEQVYKKVCPRAIQALQAEEAWVKMHG